MFQLGGAWGHSPELLDAIVMHHPLQLMCHVHVPCTGAVCLCHETCVWSVPEPQSLRHTLRSTISDEVRREIQAEEQAIQACERVEWEEEMEQNVWQELRAEMKGEVWLALRAELHRDVWLSLKDELHDNVRREVHQELAEEAKEAGRSGTLDYAYMQGSGTNKKTFTLSTFSNAYRGVMAHHQQVQHPHLELEAAFRPTA